MKAFAIVSRLSEWKWHVATVGGFELSKPLTRFEITK